MLILYKKGMLFTFAKGVKSKPGHECHTRGVQIWMKPAS